MSKQVKGTTVQDIQKILTQTQNELKQAQVDTQKIRESQKLSRERLNQLKQKDMEIKKAITSINQTKREAQRTKTTKIPKSTKQKIMEAIKPPSLDTSKSPINTLAKQSKTYHKAGGLDRGVSGRGNKPKNMNEYINRLKYLGSQLTIGGLKEFTYPASANLGKPEDLGETVLQIAGGLLTPSPVDLVFAVTITKGLPKLKSKLNKYLYSDEIWANKQIAAKISREAEREAGRGGISVLQIREGQKALLPKLEKISPLSVDEIKEFNKLAKALDEMPSKAFNGLSASELRNAHKVAEKLDIKIPKTKLSDTEKKILAILAETEKGRSGLSISEIRAGFKAADEIAEISSLKTLLSESEYKLLEKELKEAGLNINEVEKADTTQLKTWMKEIEEFYKNHPDAPRMQTVEEMAIYDLDWTDDQYTNFLEAYKDTLNPDLAVAILSNLPDSKRKEIVGTATDDIEKLREAYNEIIDKPTPPPEETITETPPIPDEEDDTTPAPPREEEDHDIPTPTIPIPDVIEDIDDPTPDPEPPPPTEPIILTPKDKDELKRNRVKLYNGPITEFRVTFHYKNGVKQSTKIKARSYPEALNKAQFNRSGNKRVLKIIDLEKVK